MDVMHRGPSTHRLVAGIAAILIIALIPLPASTETGKDSPLKFELMSSGLAKDGLWKSTPTFADINKDGFPDLAVIPRLGKGAAVWLGSSGGEWRIASDGLGIPNSCGGGVDFGDINKDGFVDLAVADHCSGVYLYLGNGQGQWQMVTQELGPAKPGGTSGEAGQDDVGTPPGAEDLALGDVNEDGHLDLVAAASDEGGFSVFFGDGSGKTWKEALQDGLPSAEDRDPEDENMGGWANQVLLYDTNGDKHLDVVASYSAGPRVWLGDGKGKWTIASNGLPTPRIGGLYRGMAVGDIDEDGRTDLVAANDVNGVEVYLQQSDGSWRMSPDVLPSLQGGAVSVALGDLNRDGHLDLIAGGSRLKGLESSYGLFICTGDGKGTFQVQPRVNLPAEGLSVTWGITVEDINKDGLLDIAVGTGGVGMPQAPPKQVGFTGRAAPAESFPRLQVWVNRLEQS